jgi:hypothetical protein
MYGYASKEIVMGLEMDAFLIIVMMAPGIFVLDMKTYIIYK